MTFKELEFFYALCKNPHVLEVSKSLHVSQSTVSLAIKSLEKKLDEKLFDRIGKRLVLNERGRCFQEETYPSFLKLQEAQTLFKKEKLGGVIKVACSKTIGGYVTPSIFYEFISQYPKIYLEKTLANSSTIIEALKSGKIDIGFVENEFEEDELMKEELCSDELIVVTSNQTLPKENYIDTLYEKNWVLRESGSGTKEVFLNALGELGKNLHVKMEFQDFEEVKTLLAQNKNILTCLSKYAVQKELEAKEIQQIKIKNIEFKRKFYCVYHKKKHQSKVFEVFKHFVSEKIVLLS